MAGPLAIAAGCHYVGFCALNTADQAAWAAAIGSIAAAIVALGIALSGGVARLFQRRADGRALAAYLATDVDVVYEALGEVIAYLEKFLETGVGATLGDLSSFGVQSQKGLAATLLEAKVDRFGTLPSNMGEKLAGAVGSLPACRSGIDRFTAEVRVTKPADYATLCSPILDQLRNARHNMARTHRFCRRVRGSWR